MHRLLWHITLLSAFFFIFLLTRHSLYAQNNCISSEQAAYHIGETICVQGVASRVVVDTDIAGAPDFPITFIYFGSSSTSFSTIAPDLSWDSLEGRCVQVTGEIETSQFGKSPIMFLFEETDLRFCDSVSTSSSVTTQCIPAAQAQNYQDKYTSCFYGRARGSTYSSPWTLIPYENAAAQTVIAVYNTQLSPLGSEQCVSAWGEIRHEQGVTFIIAWDEDDVRGCSSQELAALGIGSSSPSLYGSTSQSFCSTGCSYHPTGCDIKGNVSYDTGEKIYHFPGGYYYDSTVINPAYGERWFCTAAEAERNGWRRARY